MPMAARASTISSVAPELAKDSLLKNVAVFPLVASLLFGAEKGEMQDERGNGHSQAYEYFKSSPSADPISS